MKVFFFFCNAYFSETSKISLIQIVTAWQTWNLIMLNQVLVEVCRGVWNSVTGCSYPERFALETLNIVFHNVPIINIAHGTLYAAALCVCGVWGFFAKLSSCFQAVPLNLPQYSRPSPPPCWRTLGDLFLIDSFKPRYLSWLIESQSWIEVGWRERAGEWVSSQRARFGIRVSPEKGESSDISTLCLELFRKPRPKRLTSLCLSFLHVTGRREEWSLRTDVRIISWAW